MPQPATRSVPRLVLAVTLMVLALWETRGSAVPAAVRQSLASALVFHSPFDGEMNARVAAGDGALYWAPSWNRRQEAQRGVPASGETRLAPGEGRFRDAIRFTRRGAPLVFYNGGANLPYAKSNWQGSASFWLNTDPQGELGLGFCDPIQLLGRSWNDAGMFVEFEKTPDAIPFRLGVYADLDVWNPTKRRIQDIPSAERPLLTVTQPPFAKGKWTHVVFTWESFNTGRVDGIARLYLDGQAHGELTGRQQTFTWEAAQSKITLGLNYSGLMDELAIFNRRLTAEEVSQLHRLDRGIESLGR